MVNAKSLNRLFHGSRIFSVVLIALLSVCFSNAQTVLYPGDSITGDDPDGTAVFLGDAFAAGADTWDDWLFVGAPRETAFRDGNDYQDGGVYVYEKVDGTFVFRQKLTMPGNSGLLEGWNPVGDRFGSGVEAAAGWLFVAAVNDQYFPGLSDPREGLFHPDDPAFQFAGQVHVYALSGSTWNYVQTLISPAPGTNGSFGSRTQASHMALDSQGTTAVIGELDNFPGGVGQLHTYRLKHGKWVYKETIDAPFAEIDTFGDELTFANDQYLVAGGSDTSDDGFTNQGYVFVYERKDPTKPGKFYANPTQTIAGPVVFFADCNVGGFGQDGLDAAGGVVVVADPCAPGTANDSAGAVNVYRLSGGTTPLVLEETIEGDEPNLFFGANWWGSRNAVAVSDDGARILIGSPQWQNGGLDDGADVRVYVHDSGEWTQEFNLTTPTPAADEIRAFGDTVFFANNETAFVRENNFLSPVETGWKGQGFFYDLTPTNEISILDSNGAVGRDSSVAIGTDGYGLISYLDNTNTDLKVAHCNDVACTSATLSVLDSAGSVGYQNSAAIGVDGLGLISYHDGTNDDLKVAHCDDAACTSATLSTVDSAGDVGYSPSVAIGADGLGLISYAALVTTGDSDLKVAHCSDLACTSATLSTVDSVGDIGQWSSVAIGADGLGLISYLDATNMDLKVAHCSDAACTSATLSTVDSAGNVGLDSSVAIGADGLGLVSYWDGNNRDLKVAHCNDAACTSAAVSTLDSIGDVGQFTSVAIGADGFGLISYYDATNGDLKVAHCDNAACTSASLYTLDGAGNVGWWPSVAIGPYGSALISYYDVTNEDLKVAHLPYGF